MHTLSDKEVHAFLEQAKDDPFYRMYYVDFFTGMRESELIGLTWDCVDFEHGVIRIYRQFVRIAAGPDKGAMMFTSLKNHKERLIFPAPSVLEALKAAQKRQEEQKRRAGSSWNNEHNMVFTRDNGMFVRFKTLYLHFKALAAKIAALRCVSTTSATPIPRWPFRARWISRCCPPRLGMRRSASRWIPTAISATP